jgi:transposase
MSRKVRTYTVEFIAEAVRLGLKSPSPTRTAHELGIPGSTLRSWIKASLKKSNTARREDDKPQDLNLLLQENRRLHKELEIAKEEKEILKKAAAYFAQHQK